MEDTSGSTVADALDFMDLLSILIHSIAFLIFSIMAHRSREPPVAAPVAHSIAQVSTLLYGCKLEVWRPRPT